MTARHRWRCACCDTPVDGTRRSLLGAAASIAGAGLLSACAPSS